MPRWLMFGAVAAIALGLFPAGASGQSVLFRIVDEETSAPVFGAIAYLLDERGDIVRSILTDEQGRALFVSVPAARYRVRAEMIGMATLESNLFDVTEATAFCSASTASSASRSRRRCGRRSPTSPC
jgi:hypothetical protein